MTKICIPIVEKTLAKIHEQARTAKAAGADLVEIWLGELPNCDLGELTTGNLTSNKTYTLTCIGVNGTNTNDSVTITVN